MHVQFTGVERYQPIQPERHSLPALKIRGFSGAGKGELARALPSGVTAERAHVRRTSRTHVDETSRIACS